MNSRLVNLVVDSREPRTMRDALVQEKVVHTVSTLDTADFHFIHEGTLLATVERKTWSDLESARITGRFEDQLNRALAHACQTGAMHFLLVEEPVVRSDERLRAEPTNKGLMAASAINRCMLQRGVSVLRTCDTKDTARLLAWIKRKCEREHLLTERETTEPYGSRALDTRRNSYSGGVVHAKKRKNQDNPEACWINMLTVIPGMSENVARSIKDVFADAAELIAMAKKRKQDHPTITSIVKHATVLVADVKVGGSKRRVGPALAGRVTSCLMGSLDTQ
ncbi:hypothetical protein CYMTET_3690 [Cymbomonas tetramitiformis]|uniref:Crossover junction endonuclease MUS81 n=1 Tax=Cymbomonas tetramitiformis TaxID=36881 RepID=A0AAE0H302_9CHLO|nr:hypothetical protein CYMTET_3690 [Cymbomonas tetramitiformis]|eukprot:gene993-1513_t